MTSEEAADGEEYSRSLETQGEVEAYLQAYAALLADRREALTSERTLLAAHDVKEKKARHTKAALKAATAVFDDDDLLMGQIEQLDEEEAQPEHQVLRHELADERRRILNSFGSDRALRSVMVDLNNVAASIANEQDPERVIAKSGSSKLRELISQQGKSHILKHAIAWRLDEN